MVSNDHQMIQSSPWLTYANQSKQSRRKDE